MNDLVFEKTRKVLLSKQKELKGKGNKPNASIALTSDKLNTLYKKGLLGTQNPEALLNTLWLDNTMYFGLRGCKEHKDMRWGDVKLKVTADSEEYFELRLPYTFAGVLRGKKNWRVVLNASSTNYISVQS